MKLKPILIVSTMSFFLFTIMSFTNIVLKNDGEMKDIDGNVYKIVKIGEQQWFSENLKVSHFRNGDEIAQAKTLDEWKKAGEKGQPAWCYFDNDPENGYIYGKLYNWYAVNDPRGLAPIGWHIPNETEWNALENYLGKEKAGKKMKSKTSWLEKGNGTNKSGFLGLPGGYRDGDGSFKILGKLGGWWSSNEYDKLNACSRALGFTVDFVASGEFNKDRGFSVRCIKD